MLAFFITKINEAIKFEILYLFEYFLNFAFEFK